MPALLSKIFSSAITYLVLTVLVIGFLFYLHHSGYEEGKKTYSEKQKTAQQEQDKRVENDYEKIDKKTPFNADKQLSGKWLLNYTAPNQ